MREREPLIYRGPTERESHTLSAETTNIEHKDNTPSTVPDTTPEDSARRPTTSGPQPRATGSTHHRGAARAGQLRQGGAMRRASQTKARLMQERGRSQQQRRSAAALGFPLISCCCSGKRSMWISGSGLRTRLRDAHGASAESPHIAAAYIRGRRALSTGPGRVGGAHTPPPPQTGANPANVPALSDWPLAESIALGSAGGFAPLRRTKLAADACCLGSGCPSADASRRR